MNIFHIRRIKYKRNGIETIVNKDGILWLNEKHTEEGLDHQHLQKNIIQTIESIDMNQLMNRNKIIQKKFNRQMLAIKVIMGCRKTSAHKYRTKLGFKQYDVILTKKQSMLTEITTSFEGKTCKQKIMLKDWS